MFIVIKQKMLKQVSHFSNYELNRLLSKRNNKRVIGVIKDEKIGKTYIYLTDDGSEDKIS